jgi:pyridoxal phosphate enzyme (YggS family)
VTATLENNFRRTQAAIAAESKRTGRTPTEVTLLAVTKSVDPQLAHELAQLGQKDLGENRLPSLLAKREFFESQGTHVTWHYIGHIQRNKARRVLQSSDVLHSVDTLQLIETLERIAAEENRRVPIYLEVKLSTDPLKHGFELSDLPEAIALAGAAPHLELLGLMTMASRPDQSAEPSETIPMEFRTLQQLAQDYLGEPQTLECFHRGRVRLSMGMSGDFPAAIAAGSHMVRIGSALFRDLPDNSTDSPNQHGEVTR